MSRCGGCPLYSSARHLSNSSWALYFHDWVINTAEIMPLLGKKKKGWWVYCVVRQVTNFESLLSSVCVILCKSD